MEIPPKTIIAFSGTLVEAQAQQQYGWWICDGQRVINDPQSPLNGHTTPDLRDRFLMGSSKNAPGETGGHPKFKIPSQTINSHTTGGFGDPRFNGDPFTHMQGSHGWTTDASIYSQGTWEEQIVDTLPPYYSIIYLITVR